MPESPETEPIARKSDIIDISALFIVSVIFRTGSAALMAGILAILFGIYAITISKDTSLRRSRCKQSVIWFVASLLIFFSFPAVVNLLHSHGVDLFLFVLELRWYAIFLCLITAFAFKLFRTTNIIIEFRRRYLRIWGLLFGGLMFNTVFAGGGFVGMDVLFKWWASFPYFLLGLYLLFSRTPPKSWLSQS